MSLLSKLQIELGVNDGTEMLQSGLVTFDL